MIAEKVEQINWDSLEPAERGEINWDSLVPAEDSAPGMDPAPSGPEGVNSQDRILGAWNKATQMTKVNVMNTKVVGGMMAVEEFKQVGEAGAYAYGEVFRRPLAALTALAVETPFADEDKGVMSTVAKGFMDPEKYPPQKMTTALIDAGMEPTSAAALATLGQFGYYMGMGQTFARVIQSGKVGLLNKTLNNIDKAVKTKGIKVRDMIVLTPEEAAANNNVLDVADVYLRSRGLKIAGVNKSAIEGSAELVLKRIGNLNPEAFVKGPKQLPVLPTDAGKIVRGMDGKPITLGLDKEARKYKTAEEFVESKALNFEVDITGKPNKFKETIAGREDIGLKTIEKNRKIVQQKLIENIDAEKSGDKVKSEAIMKEAIVLAQRSNKVLEAFEKEYGSYRQPYDIDAMKRKVVGGMRETQIEYSRNLPGLEQTENKIKVYRGIDSKTVKTSEDENISPGDFVSLDKSYAKEFGDIILELEVPKSALRIVSGTKELILNPTKSQLTDIWKKAQGVPPPIDTDLNIPVSNAEALANLKALDPNKQKIGVHDLIVPAEYVLKQMGLDEYIGSPLRQAVQDTRIEYGEKMEFLSKTKQEHLDKLPAGEQVLAKENVWQYGDKGIPKDADPRDAKVAKMFKKETEEMLKRLNETNRTVGLPEIVGLENYMYHMVMPEIINDLIKTGQIAEGFKRIIRPGVSTELFLKTAQERKGMPEEYLVKDPYEVMRVMYAIDLKYINLQKALSAVEPYLKGVKTLARSGEKWDTTVVTYLDEWINHAIKKQPTKTDLRAQASLDSLVNFVFGFAPGKVAPELSFDQITGVLSSAAQTGALGLRLKVAIRNLGQTSLDWVMYGTKAYAKGLSAYGSEEGMKVLKKSRVWRGRMPIEAQDRNTLSNFMKKGSFLYRKADMRSVGIGILTRYHYAKNVLGMGDKEALSFADTDLAGTQWSYTREDLPEIYWSATGRTLATFGSWWMNYFNRFLPEVVRKTFNGTDATGRVVGAPERMAGVRLIVLMGVAEVIRRISKEALGVAIDFTGVVAPMPFGKSPQVQFLTGAAKVAQGLIGDDDRMWSEGWRDISEAGQMFIPYWLTIKETTQLVTGVRSLIEYLLYTDNANTGGAFYKK